MAAKIIPVKNNTELKAFLKLPWTIYKGDKNWVPPLLADLRKSVDPLKSKTLSKITNEKFLAVRDGIPVGRIFVGIDNVLNDKKGTKAGYFSLFECIKDFETARELMDTALVWFRQNGVDYVRGPVSPTGSAGDDYKGLLIDCFDRPPVLLNSYNPSYYKDFIETCGFEKDLDLFAYHIDPKDIFSKNPSDAIEYAKKRYNFRVDTINLKDVEREMRDIKHILDLAIPDEWPDLVAPSLEEVRETAKGFIPLCDPEIILIARSGDEPIGFSLALPDYNQVLIHLNGRLTPLSALKFLWYRRKIDCARMFTIFVVPAYRKKGVSYALCYQAFVNAMKKGFAWGEGSTIGETNARMRKDIESAGGRHYKTYRIYGKAV